MIATLSHELYKHSKVLYICGISLLLLYISKEKSKGLWMTTWIQEFINIYFLFSSYLVLYISFISQQCWLSFLKLLFCSSINIGISFKNKPASKLLGDLNTSEAVIIFIFIFLKPNEENVGSIHLGLTWHHLNQQSLSLQLHKP